MSKRTWRWVTRDLDYYVRVWPRHEKPVQSPSGWWDQAKSTDNVGICFHEFKALFGFLPPTDRPIRVEFKAKVLEDGK